MSNNLRSHLQFEPRPLGFGTSGRRGEIVHLTQLELYINVLAELRYLQSLAPSEGGIIPGDPFFFAYDLRPSSASYVEEQQGCGEIAQSIERAVRDAGMSPVHLGCIPTPALTYYALRNAKGSIMVTGSHIPFDRNGYKLNTSQGELLKEHEEPITKAVAAVREQIYSESFDDSPFNAYGQFKAGHCPLPAANNQARAVYLERYLNFFGQSSLKGLRLLVYQHSAVGRDLLVELLRQLGAEVIPFGRSESFVPIDTENIDPAQLAIIQELTNDAIAQHGPADAVVSLDGDSDRPLILSVDRHTGQVCFFGGDLVGMITARYLGADAVVVPISCNDGIECGDLAPVLQPRTRIGSPYVIAGMNKARASGKQSVCGWEANGGFLLGSDIRRGANVLEALPTRDAFLPILCTLFSAHDERVSIQELFSRLPARYSRAALLKNFPRSTALTIIDQFSPSNPAIKSVCFTVAGPVLFDSDDRELPLSLPVQQQLAAVQDSLSKIFGATYGFTSITRMNFIDGVRVTFSNGDIAHVRPSGNADEFRIYAVAGSQQRADQIAAMAIEEPDGLLRQLEHAAATG